MFDWKIWFAIGCILHPLCDQVDHSKGATMLYDLWHGLRDLVWIDLFFIGMTFNWHEPFYVYIAMVAGGAVVWQIVYEFAKKIKFHTLDNVLIIPLPFEVFGFGKFSRKSIWQWLKEKFWR